MNHSGSARRKKSPPDKGAPEKEPTAGALRMRDYRKTEKLKEAETKRRAAAARKGHQTRQKNLQEHAQLEERKQIHENNSRWLDGHRSFNNLFGSVQNSLIARLPGPLEAETRNDEYSHGWTEDSREEDDECTGGNGAYDTESFRDSNDDETRITDDTKVDEDDEEAPTPRKKSKMLTSPPSLILGMHPTTLGAALVSSKQPLSLVGQPISKYQIEPSCIKFRSHAIPKYDHERASMKHEECVQLISIGTIILNPSTNQDGSHSLLAVESRRHGAKHLFPFDIESNGMHVCTYYATSPLRIQEPRRYFDIQRALEWLQGQFSLQKTEEVIPFVLEAIEKGNYLILCSFTNGGDGDDALWRDCIINVVIVDVLQFIHPTEADIALLRDVPHASTMGWVEAWTIKISNSKRRVLNIFDEMARAVQNRFALAFDHVPTTEDMVWMENARNTEYNSIGFQTSSYPVT